MSLKPASERVRDGGQGREFFVVLKSPPVIAMRARAMRRGYFLLFFLMGESRVF